MEPPNSADFVQITSSIIPSAPMVLFRPLIQELSMKGTKDDRTLVFCRSYDDVLSMYQTMALELDSRGALYVSGKSRTSENRLCDKYDACTALSVRNNIVSSFTDLDGVLRVVFTTTAFSMGLDSQGDSLEATQGCGGIRARNWKKWT